MVDDICQYTVSVDYDLSADTLDFNKSKLWIWSHEPLSPDPFVGEVRSYDFRTIGSLVKFWVYLNCQLGFRTDILLY